MTTAKTSKKPKLKKFIEVCEQCKGQMTNIAKALNCSRMSVYQWCKADPAFQEAIDEYKGQLLDECLKSARILALGIPKLEGGKIVGWTEKPDSYMLRYLIGTLGRREGFGENVDITSNGQSIKPEPTVIEIIDSRDKVKIDTGANEEEV